jgi:hypothetical protein
MNDHKQIGCPQCFRVNIELVRDDEIRTGDGSLVLASSYVCLDCRWQWIDNKLLALSDPQPGADHQPGADE